MTASQILIRFCCGGLLTWLLLAGAEKTLAQPSAAADFALPTNEAQWINSPPISSEALRGKAAFIWFYEESCPRCRAKWPELLALANQYQGRPIVFIAVNSGTSRASVQQYARDARISWPIIVDTDREFERQAGVGQISLQNIWQAGLITSEGNFQRGNYSQLEETVERALQDAAWKVEPAEIPPALRPAWLAIEFGNYAAAGPLVKKSLNSPKTDVKEAAVKLNEAVTTLADKQIEAAQQALQRGDKWQAYKLYQQVRVTYAGFQPADDAVQQTKDLADDEQVKRELIAQKSLDPIYRALASSSSVGRRSAPTRLRKLAEDHAGTEAAEQAERLLVQLAPQ
jgi:thiol-disulfide isomerase/thioredoxin